MTHSKWYGRDFGLSARMFIVMLLLTAVYLAFLLFLWQSGLDFFSLVVVAGALLAAQYFFSDTMVLWTIGAKEVSPAEAPELHGIVDRLVALADLPKPRVALADSAVPNALVAGRSAQHAVVAVTTALMEQLDRPELEAVIAHELTHIKNRDVAVITIASFLSTVAFFLMRGAGFGYGYSYGRRHNRGIRSIVLVYVASLVVWVISFLLIRALSRYRELAADRGSAIITGTPSQLAAALLKISGTMQRIPTRDLRQVEPMNAFFIVPSLSGSPFFGLFSTHPSLQERIACLDKMQQEMERPS